MFREVVSDFDRARELVRVTPISAKTNPQWTIQDIDNFEEWFEEIEEPIDSIHWKPKIGEVYEVADDTMYWAYQNGAPEKHKDLSILDCEIAVDGEDIDLDEWRDPSDTDS